MKTLKKLFSVSAIVALLGTLVPMYAFGANANSELEEAYQYAHANSITSAETYEAANMLSDLDRAAMAKMIANYATKVLGLEANVHTAEECVFSDVSASVDADYDHGITNACKLGLMGIGDNGNVKTTFDPKGKVTRAQFATAFSRALSLAEDGKAIENGNPYYRTHIAYLNGKGIVKSEAEYDVNNLEKRGYVMLMMMRADSSYTPTQEDDGCTAAEIAKCTADYIANDDFDMQACIAACNGNQEEEDEPVEGREEQGTLKVSEASVQPSTSAPTGVPAIEIGTLKFSAGDEDVNLYSISLEAMGTTAFANIQDVALQNKDGVKVTRTKNINAKGEAKISFVNDYTIKAGGSETLTIIATVAGAANGDTIAFKVTDFEGPEKVNGTPITTQYVSMVTNNNIGSLTVSANAADTTKVKLGEEATLGRFSVKPTNKNEDLVIKSITVENVGTVKTSYLDDLYLTVNGEKVSTKYYVDRNDIVFTTNIELDKNDTSDVDVLVKGTVTEGLGSNVRLQIAEAGDVVVEGQKYGTRVNVAGLGAAIALSAAAINIQGTAISVSFDKTDTTSTLATSKANFGTLKLKAESSDYSFNKMYLTLNTTCTNGSGLADVNIIDVTLGGESYVGTPICAANSFSIEFDDVDMDAGVSRNLPLVVELEDAAVNSTYAFDINLNDNEQLEDITNDKTYSSSSDAAEINKLLSATTFTTRTIKVEAGGLTISATNLKKQDVVLANGKEVTVGMGQFKVTNVEDATLRSLTITGTSKYVTPTDEELTLEDVVSKAYLVVNGDRYQGDVLSDKITFSDSISLTKGSTTDFEVLLVMKKKDIKAASGAIDNTSEFSITAYTYKVGNNTVSYTTPAISLGNGFEIKTLGTLTADVDTTDNTATEATKYTNVDKTVLAGSEEVVLGRFKFNATQEDVKVTKAEFTVTDYDAKTDVMIKDSLNNVRLATLDGDEFTAVTATLTTAEDSDAIWALAFEDMSYIVSKGTSQYLYLLADVNAIDQTAGGLTEASKIRVAATLTGLTAIGESSNDDIVATCAKTVSKKTSVRANMPTSIELMPVNLTLGDSVLVGKVKITMADQSVNKDDEGVLKAVLSGLNITVKGVGATTGTLVGFRKDGSSNAIAGFAGMVAADKELPAGQSVIYNIYADVESNAETPRVQISVSNVNNDVVINDQSGGVATLLNIGNGVTPELSVTSSMN